MAETIKQIKIDLPRNLPKTAVIGAGSELGSAFISAYRRLFPDIVGTVKVKGEKGMQFLDLAQPEAGNLRLSGTGHKEALILAAVTDIDRCEKEKEMTRKINVDGTIKLIRQLVGEGIKPVFFSSDYVFDGNKGGYADDAIPAPTTEYGRQKAEIESRIKEICGGNYLIVRLSKVFGLEKGDGTLLDEMAAAFKSGKTYSAAYDQIFSPIFIGDVIAAVAAIQSRSLTGIFNVCSNEAWSRYDLAVKLALAMSLDPAKAKKVKLNDLGFKSIRPTNTSMVPARLMSEAPVLLTPISECINVAAGNWRE